MEKENKVIDPKVLPIPMLGKELDRIEGDTFYLAEHEFGILYHVYNNMDLIIRQNSTATYGLLSSIIHDKHLFVDGENGEQKDVYDGIITQVMLLLSIPRIAFSDLDLYNSLSKVLYEYFKNLDNKLTEPQELQEETPKENAEFEQAAIALDELKQSIKEE